MMLVFRNESLSRLANSCFIIVFLVATGLLMVIVLTFWVICFFVEGLDVVRKQMVWDVPIF